MTRQPLDNTTFCVFPKRVTLKRAVDCKFSTGVGQFLRSIARSTRLAVLGTMWQRYRVGELRVACGDKTGNMLNSEDQLIDDRLWSISGGQIPINVDRWTFFFFFFLCNWFVCVLMVSHMEKNYIPKKCVKEGRFEPMVDGYICECMVSIININNGVIEPVGRYRKCKSIKHWNLVRMSRWEEFLYTNPCYKYPDGIKKEKMIPVQH